jgi:hypothetical protein
VKVELKWKIELQLERRSGLGSGNGIEIGRIENPADGEDGGEYDGNGVTDGEDENEGQGEIRYTNANVSGLGLGS